MYNEIQIFCNTINNFPVTFDHFNASLPNKEKKNYWPQIFEW